MSLTCSMIHEIPQPHIHPRITNPWLMRRSFINEHGIRTIDEGYTFDFPPATYDPSRSYQGACSGNRK